jgi:hypothetical protein
MNEKTISDIIAQETQVGGTHYKNMEVEPWDVIKATLTHEEWIGFLKGNIIKYAMRAGKKEGANDDPAKCRHYMHRLREEQCAFP